MRNFNMYFLKRIINELGGIKKVSDILKEQFITTVMIVTDQGIVKSGIHQGLIRSLRKNNIKYILFSDIKSEPPEDIILKGADIAKNKKVEAIIGLGGGSSLDSAKVISMLAVSEIKLENIYGIIFEQGKRLPLFLIPTTSGTGSEVTPYAVITKGNSKCTVISPLIMPDVAILDAELTLKLPSNITAITGIDAIVHAIEAFTSKNKKNIISDMFAKEALKLLLNNIEKAVSNGSNLEARCNMLLGASLAGLAFSNAPVSAVHAFAYPLGGIFHISHGLSNALMLTHVMRFNIDVALEEYHELSLYVYPDLAPMENKKEIVAYFIDKIDRLRHDLQIPTTLTEVGIREKDLELLTNEVIKLKRLLDNNPKNITLNDAFDIYLSALKV